MPSRLTFLIIAVLFNSLLISNNVLGDTLVQFKDLKFHSDFEEAVFNQYKETQEFDYFKLFLAVDKEITEKEYGLYKDFLGAKIEEIRGSLKKKLKPKKKLKKVYNSIHLGLLDKYNEKVLFSSIFEKKEYQCVTASMLYTEVFSQLDIPYSIDFIPGHVYLTAYPESTKIHVETTNPDRGIFIYNHQYKRQFVDHLRQFKIISADENLNKNVDELFKEYFLKSKQINERELAGSLYSNLGVFHLENNKIEEAYSTFLKAYFLFPSEQNKFVLFLCLGNLIDYTSATDDKYAKYLNTYCRLTEENLNTDLILGLFANLSNRQLIMNGQIGQYTESYLTLLEGISDSLLIEEISFVYYSVMGDLMFEKHHFAKAQINYQEALKIKKDNVSVQHSVIGAIFGQINFYSTTIKELIDFQDKVNNVIELFPFLEKNNRIYDVKMAISLKLMALYFQDRNVGDANISKENFESLAKKNNGKISHELDVDIESAYSAGAVYYYKKGQYKNAKVILKKGLEFCPYNSRLKMRLDAID